MNGAASGEPHKTIVRKLKAEISVDDDRSHSTNSHANSGDECRGDCFALRRGAFSVRRGTGGAFVRFRKLESLCGEVDRKEGWRADDDYRQLAEAGTARSEAGGRARIESAERSYRAEDRGAAESDRGCGGRFRAGAGTNRPFAAGDRTRDWHSASGAADVSRTVAHLLRDWIQRGRRS